MQATPTLLELASRRRRALVLGAGGASDLIQALPVANFLRLVGVEIVFGGTAFCCWGAEGGGSSREAAPRLYDVAGLQPARTLARHVVRVDSASRYLGHRPAEAILAEFLGAPALACGLMGGVTGLRDSLAKAIAELHIDLVVAVDLVGEVTNDGVEIVKTHASLAERALVAALSELEAPVIYAFGGYGVAAERPPEAPDARIGALRRAAGCLGAIEPSHTEGQEMLAAYALFPESGAGRLTPLAATVLLFGPLTLTDEAGATRLKATTSLQAIERLDRAGRGPSLETRWRPVARFRGDDIG